MIVLLHNDWSFHVRSIDKLKSEINYYAIHVEYMNSFGSTYIWREKARREIERGAAYPFLLEFEGQVARELPLLRGGAHRDALLDRLNDLRSRLWKPRKAGTYKASNNAHLTLKLSQRGTRST